MICPKCGSRTKILTPKKLVCTSVRCDYPPFLGAEEPSRLNFTEGWTESQMSMIDETSRVLTVS